MFSLHISLADRMAVQRARTLDSMLRHPAIVATYQVMVKLAKTNAETLALVGYLAAIVVFLRYLLDSVAAAAELLGLGLR
jgi:hypothetical protein